MLRLDRHRYLLIVRCSYIEQPAGPICPLQVYKFCNSTRLLTCSVHFGRKVIVGQDSDSDGSCGSCTTHKGSKSTRAKPLHWTSCLKIAEDVAHGLAYIHQAWRLVHGNLKSSNVLLGPDFEACVSDYCLAVLANSAIHDEDHDPDATAYKAPETRSSSHLQATAKSDVYAFGVLILELITSNPPSQLPSFSVPEDLVDWVKSTRDHLDDEGNGEDNRLEMLLEVAMACSLTSPEQRPTMWQVLKMLQEIKETVLLEDSELDPLHTGILS